MEFLSKWSRRFAYLLSRGREERELAEELEFHVDMEAARLLAEGMEPEEARRRARVAFGGIDRHREEVRAARGVLWLDQIRQDVSFAVRTLRRSPGFAIGALLVLGLGIGATTTAFGVVNAVLIRPLPFPDSERLVRVWPAAPSRGVDRTSFSVPDFRDWRDRTSTLSHLALYTTLPSPPVLTGDGTAEEIPAAFVAGDFFGALGVEAEIGRIPRLDEDEEGANRVIVLSHDYWLRRFGGDVGRVGGTLTINEQPFELLGVMPPGFSFPSPEVDAWLFISTIPQGSIPTEIRGVRLFDAVGRLAPGSSIAQADQELDAIAAGLARELPDSNQQLTEATLDPLRDVVVGGARAALWLVLGAVASILVIACANVAGLLLARAGERRGELALRIGLGAGRERVIRQLLVEAAVLGSLGGALGLAFAWWSTDLVVRIGGTLIPRSTEIGLDAGALVFAILATCGATLICGVLPALRATGREVQPAAAMSGRGMTSHESVGLRRTLVGAEVAVSVVLLVGAALLVRSFDQLQAVDPGFDAEGVATMTLTINGERYPSGEEYMQFYREIMGGIEALPGVSSVGSIRRLPFRGAGESWNLRIPGVFEPPPEEVPSVDIIHVGGRVFDALGVPVLEGRVFEPGDDQTVPFRIVANESFVRTYSPDLPLLGQTVDLDGLEAEVIGIVGDVHQESLDVDPVPTLYVHQEQNSRIGMAFVVRMQPGADPTQALGPLQNLIEDMDSDQPVRELAPMGSIMRESMARSRFLTLLLSSVAVFAALLASIGVYGVIATVVRQRTREVGLRMALGADRRSVVGLVMRQGLVPVAAGLVAGLTAASVASGVMDSLLFEIHPLDLTAFVAAGALVGLLAAGACGIPAAYASRLEPASVLREE